MSNEFTSARQVEFMVMKAGHGVPDDIGDLDPSIAPPIGSYEEIKHLLSGQFGGISWDDRSCLGRAETEGGAIEFRCSDELLSMNMFLIAAPPGVDAYLSEKLGALELFAFGGEDPRLIGGPNNGSHPT